jgi:ABC-type nitrate/sulfonate/bicarbonate transport system substrate-binding protein
MHRRTFLRRMAMAGSGFALAGGPTAFGDPPDQRNLQEIPFQLGWIKNFQWAGDYIADYRQYFQKYGLKVDLLSGGPTINVEPIVAVGKALIGKSEPDLMVNANSRGAGLTCIGTSYQRNVSAVMSLSKSPLTKPQDLIGKKIGVQNNTIMTWRTFLKFNKIDPSQIHQIPVQFDFTPLLSGEVDGFLGHATDGAVQLRQKGIDVHTLLLADFGYKMFTSIYIVRNDSLTDKEKRAQIVAFMKGDITGWQDAVKDPALAARLTVDVYGKGNGLQLRNQEASCIAVNDFMVSPVTRQHGLLWMTPAAIDETIASLAAGGVKATPDMFTTQILEEVYGGPNTV